MLFGVLQLEKLRRFETICTYNQNGIPTLARKTFETVIFPMRSGIWSLFWAQRDFHIAALL
jgi:hypothetical protein